MKGLRLLIPFLFLPLIGLTQIVGKVVSISDGDTFTLLVDNEQIKVRLHGIDCPEKTQDFGAKAKDYLSMLIWDKEVKIDKLDTDRYGRVIAMAWVSEKNINEELLKAGLAWHYKYYDKNPKWSEFEEIAKERKIGIWSSENPVPPWEWRKSH